MRLRCSEFSSGLVVRVPADCQMCLANRERPDGERLFLVVILISFDTTPEGRSYDSYRLRAVRGIVSGRNRDSGTFVIFYRHLPGLPRPPGLRLRLMAVILPASRDFCRNTGIISGLPSVACQALPPPSCFGTRVPDRSLFFEVLTLVRHLPVLVFHRKSAGFLCGFKGNSLFFDFRSLVRCSIGLWIK